MQALRLPDDRTSASAQYTLRATDRNALAANLKERGVPTAAYYPLPLSQQTAYQRNPVADGGTPNADLLAGEVLSLPMHPYLEEATQDYIIDCVRDLAG